MNIFAAIKKAINSDLNKPLNVTLAEIQGAVNNSRAASRNVRSAIGVPYNATVDSQVITDNDTALVSVAGAGRILQILPLCDNGNGGTKIGTALLTVDGETVFNAKTIFATMSSELKGLYILNDIDINNSTLIYCDLFSESGIFYIDANTFLKINPENYSRVQSTLIAPQGVPFNNGFELKMTQSVGATANNTLGVVVVYELYE